MTNLGIEPVSLSLPAETPTLHQIDCPGPVNGRIEGRELRLPGQSTIYARVLEGTGA